MKEKLLAVGLLIGVAIVPPMVGSTTPQVSAQVVQPKPTTAPVVVTKPAGSPAAAPVAPPAVVPAPAAKPVGAPAPRAGGFPMELALPLLAGGGAALGGGTYLLRRGKRAG